MQELLRESAKKSAVPFAGTDWLRFNNCRQWVRNTKQIGQTTQATHQSEPQLFTRAVESPPFQNKHRLIAAPYPTSCTSCGYTRGQASQVTVMVRPYICPKVTMRYGNRISKADMTGKSFSTVSTRHTVDIN